MKLTPQNLRELASAAQKAAGRAVDVIKNVETGKLQIRKKEGDLSKAASIVTQVDLACQQVILAELRESIERYDLGILTEELQDDRSRLAKDYFWCIDPLDGTLPFTEQQPGYAVSIALVSREGVPTIGVIHDPVTNRSCTAIDGLGVTWTPSGPDMEVTTQQDLICYVDRSFMEAESFKAVQERLQKIVQDLGLNELVIRSGAGAVMNAMGVLQHKQAVYFKFPKESVGGGSLWDFTATACIFNELNLLATDIHGQPLNLNNRPTTFMHEAGVLYASNSELTQKIRKVYQDRSR